MFVPLLGFAPDADPTTPGILVDCSNVIPTQRGLKAAPSAFDQGISALASECLGAALLRKLDNTARLIAGTATALYELNGTSWTDRTRTVGGAYALGSDDRWRLAQFGDVSLAAAKSDTLQASSSGAFADISGAPKAAIVETVGEFVFLFNTNEGTFGDSPDRWWCSAIRDHTNWTPAIATQCATNRITSIPGRIRAGKRFGDRVIVYKERGMSIGTYTGPSDFIWAFADLPGDIGAVSQEVVVNLGNAHLFLSAEGFYVFDGVQATPIDNDVREWWRGRVNKTYLYRATAMHDRDNSRVIWWYPTVNNVLDEALVYNYRSQRWGLLSLSVEAVVRYVASGLTYDGFGTSYATFNDAPLIPYDSPIWESGSESAGLFDTSHELMTLSGPPGSWSMTTGDFGDDNLVTLLSDARPRFITAPTAATFTHQYRDQLDASLASNAAVSLLDGRWDALQEARYHRASLAGSGAFEILGFNAALEPTGAE